MGIFGHSVWRVVLIATAVAAIGVSAVHAQIGLGGLRLSELDTSATSPGRDATRPATLYGTNDSTAHTLQAFAFEPFTAADDDLSANAQMSRFCTSGTCFVEAPLLLPAGALIESFELEACDASASAFVHAALIYSGALESGSLALAQVSTGQSQTPGCDFFSVDLPTPETVDNFEAGYVVQVFFSGGTNASTRFQAVRVFYSLQVSPPPGTATFDDVPTGHPFFPFVEALAASGITGGCGGGSYCPGAPLTRGQMAAFLAKALGLHWAP